jgi:2'-5' RNA ligase
VPINPGALPALLDTYEKLRSIASDKQMKVRWVPAENWHITLRFLGDTSADHIIDIKAALNKIAQKHQRMTVHLDGIGSFPNARRAKVIWAGLRKAGPLVDLQRDIDESLSTLLHLEPEKKEYTPHATLGRLRKPVDCNTLLSPFAARPFGSMNITDFTIFESVMKPTFSSYIPLNSISLMEV